MARATYGQEKILFHTVFISAGLLLSLCETGSRGWSYREREKVDTG